MAYLNMDRSIFRLTLVVVIILSLTAVSMAADDLFNRTQLNVKGTVRGKIFRDVNGDGYTDMVVLHNSGFYPNVTKYASVFLQTAKGFNGEPDNSIVVPDDLVLVDVSDVAGDSDPELIMMGKGGVYYFRNQAGFFDTLATKFIDTETAITVPAPGEILYYDFVRPVAGFEDPLIIVPRPSEFVLFSGKPGLKYREISKIHINEEANIRETGSGELPGNDYLVINRQYPKFIFADLNGDGVDDIFCTEGGQVNVFYASDKLTYNYEPDKFIDLKLISNPEHEKGYARVNITITDVNQDKVPDISATKITGSIMNYDSKLEIYLGNKNGQYPASPSFSLSSENTSLANFLRDFNGDGKKDVMVPAVRLGIFGIVKLFLMKKVDMFVRVYLQDNNSFHSEPDFEKKITYNADLDQSSISLSSTSDFDGDINGDGINDLVINPGDNTLRIFLGSATEIFQSDEYAKVELEAPTTFTVIDLDGDKKGELVVTHENDKGHRGIVTVLSAK